MLTPVQPPNENESRKETTASGGIDPRATRPGQSHDCQSSVLSRRRFVESAGLVVAGIAAGQIPVMAGPFAREDFERLVPADKRLHPDWVKSLFARGTPTVYRWPESRLIGMPVGGICSGQVYLGGDGRLWRWDVFNLTAGTSDRHYAHPPEPASPLNQGFAMKVTAAGETQTRRLDHTGWRDIEFCGEYPIGAVTYRDPASPVSVTLEAFSPFIPLNAADSSLPAIVLEFTINNTSKSSVDIELAGWIENAVCMRSASESAGIRRNRILRHGSFTMLECSADALPSVSRETERPDIVLDDFEREAYERWTNTGSAFGAGPVAVALVPSYQGDVGARGKRLVNSHASAPGSNVEEKDSAIGRLRSAPFVIERDYITFLIGGGAQAGKTCMNLLIDGETVLSATGQNDNRLGPRNWDVRRWAGRRAELEIVDQERGGWGNIGVDEIVLTDQPRPPLSPLNERSDFGSMGLVLPRSGAQRRTPRTSTRSGEQAQERLRVDDDPLENPGHAPDFGASTLSESGLPWAAFAGGSVDSVSAPFDERLIGSLGRRLRLKAGGSDKVTFVIVWHFPNLRIDKLGNHMGRHYGVRFTGARAVANYVVAEMSRLVEQTRRWRQTWYDSTLPRWFLDRTMAPTSHLATNTCFWLGNGRFYAWEGVGCCAGTCTHVWHYAQAMAHLFPELERSARALADYSAGFDATTGRIRFRAEHNDHWAVDGQAGCILRVFREHQMSADDAFLRRIWPRVKQSIEFLIGKDEGQDGILDGPQHNTLDADWHGQVAWLSGLYLAALRAGEEMAREMGDSDFARKCRRIFDSGRQLIDERLFNGEYYVQHANPSHAKTVGSYDGCEIDQVLGDSWAWQVGLGRILSESHVKSALRSLWRYNFTPDVGTYRVAYPAGRWYAAAGEAGLLMCTWPRGEAKRVKEGYDYYFNECMTGFEYQVAWHCIGEGMLLEGLAIARAIHDRYHASRRNPWNEVECGDHYARAMAAYGVYLAACGFEHHGPQGHIGFTPRLNPEDFRCAFTSAEGWGTFDQQAGSKRHRAKVIIRMGKLRLRSLALGLVGDCSPRKVVVVMARKRLGAVFQLKDGKALIRFDQAVVLEEGEMLTVTLTA